MIKWGFRIRLLAETLLPYRQSLTEMGHSNQASTNVTTALQ